MLEEFLIKEFPTDKFTPVKKGQRGADVIQSVVIKGEAIGNILHESKDVLNFDEKWVQKLLDDMEKLMQQLDSFLQKPCQENLKVL